LLTYKSFESEQGQKEANLGITLMNVNGRMNINQISKKGMATKIKIEL